MKFKWILSWKLWWLKKYKWILIISHWIKTSIKFLFTLFFKFLYWLNYLFFELNIFVLDLFLKRIILYYFKCFRIFLIFTDFSIFFSILFYMSSKDSHFFIYMLFKVKIIKLSKPKLTKIIIQTFFRYSYILSSIYKCYFTFLRIIFILYISPFFYVFNDLSNSTLFIFRINSKILGSFLILFLKFISDQNIPRIFYLFFNFHLSSDMVIFIIISIIYLKSFYVCKSTFLLKFFKDLWKIQQLVILSDR